MRSRTYPLFALLLWLMMLFAPHPAQAVEPGDLLKPEQAFTTRVDRSGDLLLLTLDVADGYYVYRDRVQFSTSPAGLLQAARFPQGQLKNDPYFGRQVIYEHSNQIEIPLHPGSPQRFTLTVKLQGCAKVGVCYPPYTRRIEVGGVDARRVSWAGKASPDSGAAPGGGLPLTLFAFFAAGIGMAFTACMYPLLPILSALVAGQGTRLTRMRGFTLSMAYVQGLALTYTVVGVVAGLTGALLTVWLQQPAVVLTASALMVLFALSMFDLYSIQLPSALQSRLAETSNRLPGGRFVTVALMGMLSALIIGPCIAPPLALALGYIGSTGNALLGAAALYLMALGLGLPLLLIGTFGGHVLPRAGRWMKAVKSVFGVIMLALALRLAAPFLPAALVLALWAALAIGVAVFLRAFDALPPQAHAMAKLGKALGLALFLVGVAELAGALAGARDPRFPLAWLAGQPAQAAVESSALFQPVEDSPALDRRLQLAAGRPVLLDFYADWCVSCKEMDDTSWRDPAVRRELAGFVALRADVTQNNPAHAALLGRFDLFGPPGIIVFDATGHERDRLIGYIDPSELRQRLAAARQAG
jgi:thioredoxin:protein disulfide reductase